MLYHKIQTMYTLASTLPLWHFYGQFVPIDRLSFDLTSLLVNINPLKHASDFIGPSHACLWGTAVPIWQQALSFQVGEWHALKWLILHVILIVGPSFSLSKNLIDDQSGDRLVEALISCSHLEELK